MTLTIAIALVLLAQSVFATFLIRRHKYTDALDGHGD